MFDRPLFTPIEARYNIKIDLFPPELPQGVAHVPFHLLNQGTLHLGDGLHRYVCRYVQPADSSDGLVHRGGLVIASPVMVPIAKILEHINLAERMGYYTAGPETIYHAFGGLLKVNNGIITNESLALSANLPSPFPSEELSQIEGKALQMALEISRLTGICIVLPE